MKGILIYLGEDKYRNLSFNIVNCKMTPEIEERCLKPAQTHDGSTYSLAVYDTDNIDEAIKKYCADYEVPYMLIDRIKNHVIKE